MFAAADRVSTSSGVAELKMPPAASGERSIGMVVFASATFIVSGRNVNVFAGELSKSASR